MNALTRTVGLALLLCASASVAPWPATAACIPRVEQPWLRSPPPSSAVLAGYARIRNDCQSDVVVVGVESRDFGSAMIHRTEQKDGVSRMRAAGQLRVPAGSSLTLAPGGLHLMLMRPLRALKDGDAVGIRFVLADGRRLYAEYPLRRQAQ